MESRKSEAEDYGPVKDSTFMQLMSDAFAGRLTMDEAFGCRLAGFPYLATMRTRENFAGAGYYSHSESLVRQPDTRAAVVGLGGIFR
jgi:hypothetical protein